ncbi:MAG TPA: tetratricopeptide repeat protein [Myxococcales bacterium]|nr:tetratricopeptide repeat protein [Myxococcales bacterium]
MRTISSRLNPWSGPLLLLLSAGCLRAPQVHQRALENNEFCAVYISQGQLDRAETHCDLGLEFSPEYADLWVNKGLIALKRNQLEPAKEDFIKAIRYNQEHAAAYNNLGYVYFLEKKYGQAHDSFQRALKVNPDYLEARYNLALTFKSMGKKADARKEYNTIRAVNPNIANVYYDLGVMAFDEHLLEESLQELGKAVELDPKYVEAWMALGAAYTEGGKYEEAKEAYASCLQLDPDNVQCRQNAALVNRKASLLEPTLAAAKELGGREQTAPSMYQLAQQYREKGLKAEEERTLKKCLRLDQRFALCHYGLHLIFKGDHRDKDATIACQNFLKFAAQDEFPAEIQNCEKYVSSSSF